MSYKLRGDICFSNNWNGKLRTHFFTTIRLDNPVYYEVGSYYRIINGGNYAFDAKLHKVQKCLLHQLPEITCYLDTGYSKKETVELFEKMYKHKNIDWQKQQLAILLLEHQNFI